MRQGLAGKLDFCDMEGIYPRRLFGSKGLFGLPDTCGLLCCQSTRNDNPSWDRNQAGDLEPQRIGQL